MKHLLRNKTNFVVLEDFLSTLLGRGIHIQKLLESEANQEEETDKFNRVDLLAEDEKGELLIIEVQNNRADVLQLSVRQKEIFIGKEAGDIFPEYYVIKVNGFDQVAKTPLDEWGRFLSSLTASPSALAY